MEWKACRGIGFSNKKIALLGINSFHVNCGYEEGCGNAKGYDTKQKATGNGTNSTCDGEQDHSSQFGFTRGLGTGYKWRSQRGQWGKDTGIRGGCSSLTMKILSWNCRGMGHGRAVQPAKSMVLLNKVNLVFLIESKCSVDHLSEKRNDDDVD